MLAFMDESGDAGRKLEKGSSPYFVVSVVTFEEHDEAQACDDRITLLRRELGLRDDYEFHFSHNSPRVRRAFLEAVSPYAFFFHTFALNKDRRRLTGKGFEFKNPLYKFAARLTFENAKPYLRDAIVTVDGSGDRTFRNQLAAYLRQRVNDSGGPATIKKVKIQRSDGNNLLQLADYVAGVRNRMLTGKPDAQELFALIAPHQTTHRTWP